MSKDTDLPTVPGRGYFVDSLRLLIALAAGGEFAMGIGLYWLFSGMSLTLLERTSSYLVAIIGSVLVITAMFVLWNGTVGKPKAAERLVQQIAWGGDEVVLDLGCGRGATMMLASSRLKDGYSVGIDTWQGRNGPKVPKSILTITESEADGKASAVRGDAGILPLSDSSVDVVLSSFSMGSIARRSDKATLFREIERVLRDGGRVGILDGGGGADYSKRLVEAGMTDVRLRRVRYWGFPPFQMVIARKPFAR